ncbi:hypothetical protein ElyMa_003266900 [Elysia marginata]|uniref:Uncharacterized protein n=1 Tax=Elysia marginata TaxID=1093978 RepID=A0AAV4J9A0_9GAST|nr:hypothetical protein ElyMa_003266900 [Elysia marginata]
MCNIITNEVKEAIQKLKCGKAPDDDGVCHEMLKAETEETPVILRDILQNIWTEEMYHPPGEKYPHQNKNIPQYPLIRSRVLEDDKVSRTETRSLPKQVPETYPQDLLRGRTGLELLNTINRERRWRWLGHVCRRSQESLIRRALR